MVQLVIMNETRIPSSVYLRIVFVYCMYASSTYVLARPGSVNIGCAFSLNSSIGRVAKIAIDMAVEDLNSSPAVLSGTKLKIDLKDIQPNGLGGIIETILFTESEMMVIIGAETAVNAHVISNFANDLKVPVLSFSATSSSMSYIQHPFFVLTAHSDVFQMAAIADIIVHYKWREVVTVYTDDDDGRNGIAALSEKLAEKNCKISFRAALKPHMSRDDIIDKLGQVKSKHTRIIVVHVSIADLLVFDVADLLNMTRSGYVWIASSWLSTFLDTDSPLPVETLKKIQGVLTLRMHSQDSYLKRGFISRWRDLNGVGVFGSHLGLNMYGLYAYDTVWLLAHALDAFFKDGGNVSFTSFESFHEGLSTLFHQDGLKVFDGGDLLLEKILHVNMTGITGPISFTQDRYLSNPTYEVLNVIGTPYHGIGYWSDKTGLSVLAPEALYSKEPNFHNAAQQLSAVIWPGGSTDKPRGWAFTDSGRELKIGVPNRLDYPKLVSQKKGTNVFDGYCIAVFQAVLNLLPYPVPYKLMPFGDEKTSPNYTELVRLIAAGVYDAGIGDISIVSGREALVDFTQPFLKGGLVVVAPTPIPIRKLHPHIWGFLTPFSTQMWGMIGTSFIVVGAVIWTLEHRVNDQFRGRPEKQIITTLWFSFSTLFTVHEEKVISTLGRFVLIVWLFVVLIINQSYVASLGSTLTAERLTTGIQNFKSLALSKDPIGYQKGSFAQKYLVEEHQIRLSRLIPLSSPEEIDKAFRDGPNNGGIVAFVDERPYMELYLSTRCHLTIVGQEATSNGWGFAFQKDSPLAVDMSTAILMLAETAGLQSIENTWLQERACGTKEQHVHANRLELEYFLGLFVVCAVPCFLALVIYFAQIVWEFMQYNSQQSPGPSSSGPSSWPGRIQMFFAFLNSKQELRPKKKRRRTDEISDQIDAGDYSKK